MPFKKKPGRTFIEFGGDPDTVKPLKTDTIGELKSVRLTEVSVLRSLSVFGLEMIGNKSRLSKTHGNHSRA